MRAFILGSPAGGDRLVEGLDDLGRVPLGAEMPYQHAGLVTRDRLATVGTSGSAATAPAWSPERAQLAGGARTRIAPGRFVEQHVDLSGMRSG